MHPRRLHRLRVALSQRGNNLDRLRADGAQIGDEVFLGEDCIIDPSHRHLVTIADGATLAPRVIVLAHDASTKHYLGYTRIGLVHIGKDSFIGAGSILLPGITVGEGSVVGAGSVVSNDIPAGVVAAGNPCVVRGAIEDFVARRDVELAGAPIWPYQGWSVAAGLTPERREQQRAALQDRVGYLE